MHISYFSEQPMSAFDDADAMRTYEDDHPARKIGDAGLVFSNRYFDRQVAADLFERRLDYCVLAEQVGFDGVMFNEHHNTPLCMSPRPNILMANVAARTERVHLIPLGNSLPLTNNPVHIAEELAMIDLITRGRIVAGFVRGAGYEQPAGNINPAYNRERFQEAHDLILKAWTQPGPFKWEGTHYDLRIVNPWMLPLQTPHPPVWIPGTLSAETIRFAAERRYPYIALSPTLDFARKIWGYYDSIAEDSGYTAGCPQRGYLLRCVVSSSADRARENAREFLWLQGREPRHASRHPVWSAPAGFTSKSSRKKMREVMATEEGLIFDDEIASGTIFAGTPDQVIDQLEPIIEETQPGIVVLFTNDGRMAHDDCVENLELMGSEVLPALRDMATRHGIQSPFEAATPVSLAAERGAYDNIDPMMFA